MNATLYYQSITMEVLEDLVGLICLFYDDDEKVIGCSAEKLIVNLYPVVMQYT